MPERVLLPAPALTRRQLREAERQAEQAALREAAQRVAADLPDTLVVRLPLDGTLTAVARVEAEAAVPAAIESVGTGTDEVSVTAPTPSVAVPARRSRAELRAGARPSRRRSPAPRWMPRAAVLGALGAATIVAPLAGFAGPEHEEAVEVPTVATVPAGQSVLDSLEAAALSHDEAAAGSAAALMADSGATARALVQSSRNYDRDATVCAIPGGSGANGAGAALGAERVVMPLVAGSYTQSSLYGNRVHPIYGSWSMHHGLDFAAPLGTDIHAIADGVVVHAGNGIDGRSNMLVIIEHELDGQTFYSWYVHMYPAGVFVTEGESVSVGDVVGEVGNNGNSTGPPLHLEIHLDEEGTTTDPGAFLADREAVFLAANC